MKINSIPPKKLILPAVALMTLAAPKTIKADTNSKTVVEQFEKIDQNSDENISLKEYVLTKDSFTKNDLSEFEKYDTDKNNSLNLKEFVNMNLSQSKTNISEDKIQSISELKENWQKTSTENKVLLTVGIISSLIVCSVLSFMLLTINRDRHFS